MIDNPYEILGVSKDASMDEIRRAYRKKAKENHPDLHPDDPRATERMQQINAAYDMLSNPDKYRTAQRSYPGGQGAGGYNSNPYGRYGAGGYGANPYGQYGAGGFNSNSYGRYGSDPFGGYRWQYTWTSGANGQGRQDEGVGSRRASAVARPFRGLLRVVSGILLFRFLMTLLRFGLFGFFF